MKKRVLSLLTCLALCLSLLPTAALAAGNDKVYTKFTSTSSATGTGTENDPFNYFVDALNAVAEGGEIVVIGGAYVNDTSSSDSPLFIDKNVTITGQGNNASIDIRSGSIVLGANVTFQDIQLSTTNAAFRGLFANGNNLVLKNVIKGTNVAKPLNIYGGGYYDNSSWIGEAPGSAAVINISGSSKVDDVYAGSNGGGYSNSVSIVVDGVDHESIGSIYGKNSDGSAVGGTVTAELKDCGVSYVEGAVGSGKVNVTVSSSYRRTTSLTNIDLVTVAENTTFEPAALSNVKNFEVKSTATLDISKLNSKVTIEDFTGGGTLVLGESQTLTITSNVKNTTDVEIDGAVSIKQTYISAVNSAADSFRLINGGHEFQKNSNGIWTAAFSVNVKPSKYEISTTSGQVTLEDFNQNGFIVDVDYSIADGEFFSDIPMLITISKDGAAPVEAEAIYVENSGYVYSVDSLGFYAISNSIDDSKLHFDADTENPTLAAGTYTISIKVTLADNTLSESTITLTVTDPSNPAVPDAVLSGTMGSNGWYTSAVLTAPTGYTISETDSGTFASALTINTDVNGFVTYWLKDSSNNVTQKSVSVKRDATKPVISSAATSNVTASGATVTVTALDATSGIAGYSLEKTSGGGEPTITNDNGTFSIRGLSPNTSYTFTVTVTDNAGNTETKTATFTTENKSIQAELTLTADKTTVPYGGTVNLSATGGSTNGAVTYTVIEGSDVISVDASGKVTALKPGTAKVEAVMSGNQTYSEANSLPLTITVEKATPTGAPAYTKITKAGKTLADANLTVTGGTFTVPGTVSWELPLTTPVQANTAYKWLFTPAETGNYNTLSGTVTLYTASAGGGGGGGGMPSTPPGGSVTVPITGNENSVNVGASVKGDKATVDQVDLSRLDAVIGDGVNTGTVTVDFSDLDSKEPIRTVEIPANVVKEIAEAVSDPANDAESFEVMLSDGVSIEFDAEALGEKAAQADGKDITISIQSGKDAKPNQKQEAAINGRPAYDITVTSGGKTISQMGGLLTLHAPYKLQEGEKPSGILVWYVDEDGRKERCRTSYDSVRERVNWVTDHLSLYMIDYDETMAECNGAVGCLSAGFADVNPALWYHEAIDFALSGGLMNGVSAGTFAPNGTTTRAQLVTILWRMEGEPKVSDDLTFQDVAGGQWYTEAIRWAASENIVAGYSKDIFAPNTPVTREQLASILYRYAQHNGGGFSGGWLFRLDFPDASDVSGWAYEGVCWCVMNGIIGGHVDGTLDPKGSATRAQVAQMMMNFLVEA